VFIFPFEDRHAQCFKRLFRTLDLETNLRTISFSPEGAAIYVGTETGELLLIDLRALDKPPKLIAIGPSQQPIVTLSLQVRTLVLATG